MVMVKDICSSHQWSLDLIVEKIRPVTYCIELENGKIIRRHVHIHFHGHSTSPVSPPSNNANEMQEFKYCDSQLTSSTPEVDLQYQINVHISSCIYIYIYGVA